jgi:antitoxin (DNA-binding transcriptional repressor) of toxin-antitoxin stability system
MRRMPAGKFKDLCLKTLDDVARNGSTVVITKRGRPVARLMPLDAGGRAKGLAGSVLREAGDLYTTGTAWDADAS